MSKDNKPTPNYAPPIAANPETVFYLTQPAEKRKKLPFGPSVITNADRAAAAAILDKPSTPANVGRMKPIV